MWHITKIKHEPLLLRPQDVLASCNMEFALIVAVVSGALVPTIANGVWEWWLARGTRAYVDKRVRQSEAKAQADRDSIFAESKAARERVEELIQALQQQPPAEAPTPASPGFAHGLVDPAEAVEAKIAKKAEREARRLENAAAIAEALGEKAAFAKQIATSMGLDYKALLDSENTAYVVALMKRMAGGKNTSNGHNVNVAPYV